MKKFLLATALVLASPIFAAAAEFDLPGEGPVANITIPDDWKPEPTDNGVEANSPDAAIYLSVDLAEGKEGEQIVNDTIDWLTKDKGVTIDAATLKESTLEVNGMQMSTLAWDGKDADGDASIGLGFVSPAEGKVLIITYWGTKGEQDKHEQALGAIINSIKPAE